MIRPAPPPPAHPVIQRLTALAPLDDIAIAALEAALDQPTIVRARRDILPEGAPITGLRLIASGWATRIRLLADGRRQLLSFLLPGDLIGHCRQPDAVAVSTVTAITDVATCPAPLPDDVPALGPAYAMSDAYEEAYLLEHIARLGRLTAQERIYSLLLELHERLSLNGLACGRSFDLPLTQELLADSLGLTSVHINRTLKLARSLGDLCWQDRTVTLRDPVALAVQIGRTSTRVSAV